MNNEIKDWIKNNLYTVKGVFNNRCTFESWWKNKNLQVQLEVIKSLTPFINDDNIKIRVYCILNDITDVVLCQECDNPVKFHKDKYVKYCSLSCSAKSKKTQEKRKNTVKSKYGVEYISQHTDIKQKIKDKNVGTRHISEKSINCLNDPKWLYKKHIDEKMTLVDIKNILNRENGDNIFYGTVKDYLTANNIEYQRNFNRSSSAEKDIIEFIKQYNIKVETNVRSVITPYELDIYLPDLKIAIEYNGLYWHNEHSPVPKDRQYHNRKYKKCLENGIRLITIFEDEWVNRRFQIESYILSLLKMNRRLYGRDCLVEILNKKDACDFINQYHIQSIGLNHIKYAYGIFNNDELYGVMSFNHHHRNVNNDIVLNRMVFKRGYTVIGGANKLLKRALHDIENDIISWSDNRYSLGNVYQKMGFILEKEYGPDYSYVHIKGSKERIPKQSMQKRYINCLEGQTEKERTFEMGFARIWDCGKKKWAYRK